MATDDFDPLAPIFSQRDAVEMTNADAATIDNWVRYKHVLPVRVGKRRLFSFLDLLTIDLTHMLAKLFRVDITAGAFVARQSAKEYVDGLEADREDVASGQPWHTPRDSRGDIQVGFVRDRATGDLRAAKRDDHDVDTVSVILPVRQVARRLLVAVAAWSDADA